MKLKLLLEYSLFYDSCRKLTDKRYCKCKIYIINLLLLTQNEMWNG